MNKYKNRGKDIVVSTRLTSDEAVAVRERADREGITPSTLTREAIRYYLITTRPFITEMAAG